MQLSPALAAFLAVAVRLSQVHAVPISLAPADDVDDSMLLDGLDPFEDIFEPLPSGTFGDAAEDLIDAEMEASTSSASTASAETGEQVTEAFLSRYFTSVSPSESTTSGAPTATVETGEEASTDRYSPPRPVGEQPATTVTSSATSTSTAAMGEQVTDAFSDQYSTSQSAPTSAITFLSRPFPNLVLGDVSSSESGPPPVTSTPTESPTPSASILLDSEDATTATFHEFRPIVDWMPVPSRISSAIGDVDSPFGPAEIPDALEGNDSLPDSAEDGQEYGVEY